VIDSTPLALKRRAENALRRADLQPAGMPPSAILVIRQLEDPLPGALFAGQAAEAFSRWRWAAQRKVDELWQQAVRPLTGPAPPGAQAVWFLDQAEWLACLSLDLHFNRLHTRWWWESWLEGGVEGLLARLWVQEAQALPAALALVAEDRVWGVQAAPSQLAARLSQAETAAVQVALAQAYHLPLVAGLPPLVWQALRSGLPPGKALDALERAVRRAEDTQNQSAGRPAALPESHSLAALALGLFYRPAALRQALRAAVAQAPPPLQAVHTAPEVDAASAETGRAAPPSAPQSAQAPVQASPGSDAPAKDDPTQQAAAPAPPRSGQSPKRPGPTQSPAPMPETGVRTGQAAPAPTPPEGSFTRLGGVWFLVNLFAIIEDVEGADEAREAVESWLALEALARLLLQEFEGGDALDSLTEQDALWSVFHNLAGLENTPELRQAAQLAVEKGLPRMLAWLAERSLRPPGFGGGEAPALDDGPAISFLRMPARMVITRTHIDVFFDLGDIDLRVRAAGLDSDPGWDPVLGRVILFHFD
jgi:hypothetical protein